MTTRQIADFNEVSTKTVRRWVDKLSRGAGQNALSFEKLKMLEAGEKGKPVDWTEDEVYAIMKAGGRGAVSEWMKAAKKNQPTAFAPTAGSLLTEKDLAIISSLTAGIVSKVFENLNGRMSTIETRIEARQALLPPPQIKPRDHINKIVREYVAHKGVDHREAWTSLYRDFGYRTKTNPSQCAKNRGMAILDYIEAEGQIDVLEAVAMEIYGGAA